MKSAILKKRSARSLKNWQKNLEFSLSKK